MVKYPKDVKSICSLKIATLWHVTLNALYMNNITETSGVITQFFTNLFLVLINMSSVDVMQGMFKIHMV